MIDSIPEFLEKNYQLSGTLIPLVGELDLNFRLQTATGVEYILKIAHFDESQKQLEMQNAIMTYLSDRVLAVQLPRIVSAKNGQQILTIIDEQGRERFVRLLTWVPGQLLARINPHSPALLESTGRLTGTITKALENFQHSDAQRTLRWDLAQADWLLPHTRELKYPEIVQPFLEDFVKTIKTQIKDLPCQVIHNDANDYNILVDPVQQKATGIIDFGDAIYTLRIAELAILIAYAIMKKPDVLAAAMEVTKGFNQACPLLPEEIKVIYTLVGLRLTTTVTAAALNRKTFPDHAYHFISEAPAWNALKKWSALPENLVHYTLRNAANLPPCPQRIYFDQWLVKNQDQLVPMFEIDFLDTPFLKLDLQVDSLELGNNQNFETIEKFAESINRMLAEAEVDYGLGGYGEIRPFYSTDAYRVMGNAGPHWRTVHLGVDVWAPAGTNVYAPLDGTVFSVKNNAGERDYGPTVILKHQVNDQLTFYTLYGHLGLSVIHKIKKGDVIKKGSLFTRIGPPPENGNWPPHLHFQIMLDPLESKGDFPGVAFPTQQEVWKHICPDPGIFITKENILPRGFPSVEKLLKERKKNLGANLSVAYAEPIAMVRGYKQYLYDQTGRRYLDTCNNVPHVGHQHPRIVRAARRQMALLNTNTRYLYPQLTEYAAALAAKFPDPLEVCFLVNSGSEANELALRIARTCTGHREMLAVEVGYHGNTNAAIDVSAYKFNGKGGAGAPASTHLLPLPDTYRGKHQNLATGGADYAAYAQKIIDQLANEDKAPAGFICESILSCGGQIVLPENYLKEVFKIVRAAGGLCIMDEVQVGFGRAGTHFWGFELQGVVPDIVTLGKPIGNGHPLGAVVTTRKIADAFANGMEYFNTFGGNAVSCAIGREVLAVVEEEQLQENAQRVGNYLLERLKKLQQQFPIIGDVRGHGLFSGFELVKDREAKTPAPEQASYLSNRMRQRAILMSTDGPHHNVIKIKPPMCFTMENVDFLLEQLEIVLNEDQMQV